MKIDISQLERLGELIGEGLVIGTSTGEVLAASPRACALLGLPPDAEPQRVAARLTSGLRPLAGDDAPPLESPLHHAVGAPFDRDDLCCQDAGGRTRRLRLSGLVLDHERAESQAVVLVLRELPPPPPLLEPIPLDPEIRRLLQLRDEILSIASHELKNPLTVILGYGALLAGSPEVRAQPRLRRAADAVRQQSQRMRRLVEQLLDFSRMGLGRLAIQRARFDIAAQVRRVLEQHTPPQQHLRLVIEDTPLVVLGDSVRLEHMLSGLVVGATRSSEDGEVTVSVRRAGPDSIPPNAYGAPLSSGAYALIQVYASGFNTPAGDPQHLFARYPHSGESPPQADHWLGLYLGAQLVLMHEGAIWAERGSPAGGVCYALPLAE